MASPNVQHVPGDAPKDMSAVIDTARAAVDQEFQVSQRLDSKMQYQLAITGTWFGATQAFAAVVLNGSGVDPGWVVLVLVAAAAAVGTFGWALFDSFSVWKLRPDKGIGSEDLDDWATRVNRRDPLVHGEMVTYLSTLLEERRDRNGIRAQALEDSFTACQWSVGIATVEFFIVLGVRLITSL